MLFYVLPQVDTNEIAHELINRFGSFDAVFQAPIEELVKNKGIQRHSATFIKLMPSFLRYYAKGHDAPDSAHLSVEEIKEE
jgi:DNA repair protein RadC